MDINNIEFLHVVNSNGESIDDYISRDDCHEKGLWHKAVVVFIINSKNQILLQKRSADKKHWPNLWDISAGGHVLYNEFGYQAAIRECQEELGITIEKQELTFIGCSTSSVKLKNSEDNHFNEYYVVHKDIDNITLQKEEVSDIKWVNYDDFISILDSNNITPKTGCWKCLCKYFSIIYK